MSESKDAAAITADRLEPGTDGYHLPSIAISLKRIADMMGNNLCPEAKIAIPQARPSIDSIIGPIGLDSFNRMRWYRTTDPAGAIAFPRSYTFLCRGSAMATVVHAICGLLEPALLWRREAYCDDRYHERDSIWIVDVLPPGTKVKSG